LCDKLAFSDKGAWTERVFTSVVWALTESYPCAVDCIAIMKDLTQSLLELGCQSLSEGTTDACLIVNPCGTGVHLQLLTFDAAGLEAHRCSDV
jgi:hypothetical protein